MEETNGLGGSGETALAIESTCEWQIHDILLDGQERYLQPLVFQDHVAHLAHKIDWRSIVAHIQEKRASTTTAHTDLDTRNALGTKKATEAVVPAVVTSKKDGATAPRITPRAPPWEKVAKFLNQSLIELNVLADVLQVSLNKRYLTLEPTNPMSDANLPMKGAVLVGRRKALANASHCLIQMADVLKAARASRVGVDAKRFENELLELRKAWKLKKVGSTIVGDLSYHTTSSKFRQCGLFEVHKKQRSAADSGSSETTIDVTVSKEVEKPLYITVALKTGSTFIANFRCMKWDRLQTANNAIASSAWYNKLLIAQNTLLCRELFAKLALECVHLGDTLCAVSDMEFSLKINSNSTLYVQLTEMPEEFLANRPVSADNNDTLNKEENGLLFLEEALYHLFATELTTAQQLDIPRPVTAPRGLPKRLRLAGIQATPGGDLDDYAAGLDQFLLQRLTSFAKHYLLVHQTRSVLDAIVSSTDDPILAHHWCSHNSLTESSVRVQISSPEFEGGIKSVLSADIEGDSIFVHFRDGDVQTLSNNPDELAFLVKQLMAEHQVNSVVQLLKAQSWSVLSCNIHSTTPYGIPCPSVYATTASGQRTLVVQCPIDALPVVMVQYKTPPSDRSQLSRHNNNFKNALMDTCSMRESLETISLSEVLGSYFLQKIETIVLGILDAEEHVLETSSKIEELNYV